MTYIKNCEYCGKEFSTSNSRRKYCPESDTCKTYASQVRTGKREPLSVGNNELELSDLEKEKINQQISELNRNIEAFSVEFNNFEKRKELVINKPNVVQRNRIRQISIELGKLSLEEEERNLLTSEIESLEKEIKSIERFNQQQHHKIKQLNKEKHNIFLQRFRAVDKRNLLIRSHLFNKGRIEGNQIQQFKNTLTRYPFDELNDSFFENLGRPKKPFIASIVGLKGTGKTILSILIGLRMIEVFESKILFIVDADNLDKAIEYLSSFSPGNKFVIKPAEYLKDIESELKEENFEFLFIDSLASFNLNLTTIKHIQKAYSGLSIFFTMRSEREMMLGGSDIVFRTKVGPPSKNINVINGFADITLKEKPGEQGGCLFFQINEAYGFKMDLS